MSEITHEHAQAMRRAAGISLVQVAVVARCAAATVRAWEYGAPVRPDIEARLLEAYRILCVPGPQVPGADQVDHGRRAHAGSGPGRSTARGRNP